MSSNSAIQAISGSQGPQGIQGEIGPTGPAGTSGLQNATMITSTTTWTCPSGVTKVWVSMVGGGAGGGSGYYDSNSGIHWGGGGGGSGFYVVNYPITVVPETIYNVTIGLGGAGNVYIQHPQANPQGGTTSFGALLSVMGGYPGSSANQNAIGGGGAGGVFGSDGGTTWSYLVRPSIGHGGNTPWGIGGASAGYSGGTTIAATGYGSGGYGGYGLGHTAPYTYDDFGTENSEAGRAGCCIIMY